jgi:predicted metal-dependent phosphoesterase TrpH
MATIDLHSHSTYSDGLLGPAAVVTRAAERGVRVLALTDHDELGGLAEARAAAAECGIELIPGVEVSVSWHGKTLHVVGLHVDPDNEGLREGLLATRAGRHERAARIADELGQAGIDGSLAGARAYAMNPELVSRAHFARFLVKEGYARDTNAVFKRYLVEGKPGYVAHQWAQLGEAIGWIKAAGGMAVLAHPGRYSLDVLQEDVLLEQFKASGGVALEVVTGSHSPDQFGYWAKSAQRFGLHASAGSDYHGPSESRRDLGDLPALPAGCIPVWSNF